MCTSSLRIWRSTALNPTYKSLCRVAQKSIRIRYFNPRPEKVQQSVKEVTLHFENSKDINITALTHIIPESAKPVHVHNPRKVKRQWFQCQKHTSTMFSLISADLWTTFTQYDMHMSNLFIYVLFNYLFIIYTYLLENLSSFHKTNLDECKDPHAYIFFDLTNQ